MIIHMKSCIIEWQRDMLYFAFKNCTYFKIQKVESTVEDKRGMFCLIPMEISSRILFTDQSEEPFGAFTSGLIENGYIIFEYTDLLDFAKWITNTKEASPESYIVQNNNRKIIVLTNNWTGEGNSCPYGNKCHDDTTCVCSGDCSTCLFQATCRRNLTKFGEQFIDGKTVGDDLSSK